MNMSDKFDPCANHLAALGAISGTDALRVERDRYKQALTEIGFTPEGQRIVGTSNRSARSNFERAVRIAQRALALSGNDDAGK